MNLAIAISPIKKIKTIIFIIFIAFLSSCKEEEIALPTLVMHELGYENSGKVNQGGELHIDAEILADGRIKEINLEIHLEGGHKDGETWEVDTTYTQGYEDLKNASFHEHIKVPLSTIAGMYHFHLSVNDKEGNQVVYENEIEVLAIKK